MLGEKFTWHFCLNFAIKEKGFSDGNYLSDCTLYIAHLVNSTLHKVIFGTLKKKYRKLLDCVGLCDCEVWLSYGHTDDGRIE